MCYCISIHKWNWSKTSKRSGSKIDLQMDEIIWISLSTEISKVGTNHTYVFQHFIALLWFAWWLKSPIFWYPAQVVNMLKLLIQCFHWQLPIFYNACSESSLLNEIIGSSSLLQRHGEDVWHLIWSLHYKLLKQAYPIGIFKQFLLYCISSAKAALPLFLFSMLLSKRYTYRRVRINTSSQKIQSCDVNYDVFVCERINPSTQEHVFKMAAVIILVYMCRQY